jgi:cytochrome c556
VRIEMESPLRVLIGLLLGLFAGTTLTLFYANLTRTQGAYPRGVMAGMQHHFDALRKQLADPACPPDASRVPLARLRALSDEVVPAFIETRAPGPDFEQRHRAFVSSLDRALATPPTDCTALNALAKDLGDQCEACHLEFR